VNANTASSGDATTNHRLKITDAIATPPSSVASPSRPIAVVETMPIKGVVRFATIAGPAMAKTCAFVTLRVEFKRMKPAGYYRPRGAPNIRDSSQTGITITAPSRK
jgi:hypothetical protein